MKMEILLATMNQIDDSILDSMKVTSDIIVCNQVSNDFSFRQYKKNGYKVKWYNFCEKGVGLNRNNALMRAEADICLLADDDVIYDSDYNEKILSAFKKHPKADVIIFNISTIASGNKRIDTDYVKKINRFNCGKYGAVHVAFRRERVIKNAISFNLLFGGGSRFSCGEDSMFIRDCIRKGLKIIAVSDYILSLNNERDSTWFKGYNSKFFEDLGSSYVYHYGKFAYLAAILQLKRHKKIWLNDIDNKAAISHVKNGIKLFKKL